MVRAREAAALASASLNIEPTREDSLANGFTRVDALTLLDAHPDKKILLVGHEPSFSQVVYDFTGARIDFKKGGVVGITPRRGAAELNVLLRPRELEAMAQALR
jgi:phosphohistidine phosphatase